MSARLRPFLALAAMLALAAKSALATTPVEVARVQEFAPPASVAETTNAVPKSPIAVAEPRTTEEPVLLIQLGVAEPPKRDASVLGISFEGPPQ
jgi:hypothetical protein